MRVFLDIGHGGPDKGASLPDGVSESDELRTIIGPSVAYLERSGYALRVPSVPLRQRMEWLKARTIEGDFVLSFHLDAAVRHAEGDGEDAAAMPDPRPNGATIYHRADAILTDKASMLGESWQRASGICLRGVRSEALSARRRLALCSGGAWTGYVVELAFLTSPSDLARFREIGRPALVAAVVDWLARL